MRRCLGASFAALEMREVLRAVAARFALRPDTGTRRAHATALRHPRARARGEDYPRRASVIAAMPGMFCRHNRLTAKCPICSRELEEDLRSKAPVRPSARAGPRDVLAAQPRRPRLRAPGAWSRASLPARPTTAIATRSFPACGPRRTPSAWPWRSPGPPSVWSRRGRSRSSPRSPTSSRPPGSRSCSRSPRSGGTHCWKPARRWGQDAELPATLGRTATAYRAWAERAGSQAAAFTGDAGWTAQRRFGRVFERLALPGFSRGARFDLLAMLGAAGRYELEADGLHFVEDDATTLAAKRALVSGDRLLLERRASDLAEAAALPLAALDRGLAIWGTPGEHVDLTAEPAGSVAAALQLR